MSRPVVVRHALGLGWVWLCRICGDWSSLWSRDVAAVHDAARQHARKHPAWGWSSVTDLLPILERAATPTDGPTRCLICDADSDPAIPTVDGWVCTPCAISDPARVVSVTPHPCGHNCGWMVAQIDDVELGSLSPWGGDSWFAVSGTSWRDIVESRDAAVAALLDRVAS